MQRKIVAGFRLLKSTGVRSFSKSLYERAALKVRVYQRGRNKVVSLDGCHFPLRKLPNTSMKLELLSGGYELPERVAARRYIKPDWGVVELGGCIGVVACITNKLLSDPKAHVVLELNPNAIPHLESNRETNHCSFKILHKALAYDSEKVSFVPDPDYWMNFLHNESSRPAVTVGTTQLKAVLEQERFEKFAVICDIEGQEYELVMHEAESLRRAELIIMEVHPGLIGRPKIETLLAKLAELGFAIIERSALVVVLENRAVPSTGGFNPQLANPIGVPA